LDVVLDMANVTHEALKMPICCSVLISIRPDSNVIATVREWNDTSLSELCCRRMVYGAFLRCCRAISCSYCNHSRTKAMLSSRRKRIVFLCLDFANCIQVEGKQHELLKGNATLVMVQTTSIARICEKVLPAVHYCSQELHHVQVQ
jgi:hypothetical protein